jgi:hypothetical protein
MLGRKTKKKRLRSQPRNKRRLKKPKEQKQNLLLKPSPSQLRK